MILFYKVLVGIAIFSACVFLGLDWYWNALLMAVMLVMLLLLEGRKKL